MWIHMQLNWNRSSARKLRVSPCSEVKFSAKIHHLMQTGCIRGVDVLRYLKDSPTLPLLKQIKSSLFAPHSRRRSKPVCKLSQSSRVFFRRWRGSGGTYTIQVWMVGTTLVKTLTSFTSRMRHSFC